jgi:hypothetical protein
MPQNEPDAPDIKHEQQVAMRPIDATRAWSIGSNAENRSDSRLSALWRDWTQIVEPNRLRYRKPLRSG